MTTALMITTAVVCAAGQTARLAGCLLVYLLTGTLSEKTRKLAERTPVRTLMEATGTERKVLLFGWLVFGPVGEAFGPEAVVERLGAVRREQACEDGKSREFLYVHLAERYDERLEALFYLAVDLEVESSHTCFMTTFVPLAEVEDEDELPTEHYAAWPDATSALISYYGTGEAEMAAIGFGDDSAAEGTDEDSAA